MLYTRPVRRTGEEASRYRSNCGSGFVGVCLRGGHRQSAREPKRRGQLGGLYKTRIEHSVHSGALNGVWSLQLRHGTYTFKYTGRTAKNVVISGFYVTDGQTITLKDRTGACSSKRPGGCGFLSCPKPGRYSFKLMREILTFTKLQDANPNCERPVVLAGKFQRVR